MRALARLLHARGDTYSRLGGHITPVTLVSLLYWRYSALLDHATGESANAATRQRGCAGAGMRALARALHARGDTYLRGEGHITPDTLVIAL